MRQSFDELQQSIPERDFEKYFKTKLLPLYNIALTAERKPSELIDEKINLFESLIQRLIEEYKLVILKNNQTEPEKAQDYFIPSNEMYQISGLVMDCLGQLISEEKRVRKREKIKQVEILYEFQNLIESFFGKIENNKPIEKNLNFTKHLLKAIKIILEHPKANEIFTKSTLKRLKDYRSSIQ